MRIGMKDDEGGKFDRKGWYSKTLDDGYCETGFHYENIVVETDAMITMVIFDENDQEVGQLSVDVKPDGSFTLVDVYSVSAGLEDDIMIWFAEKEGMGFSDIEDEEYGLVGGSEKYYAVNLIVIQSGDSAANARDAVRMALGEFLSPGNFEVVSVVETVKRPEFVFAAENAYINGSQNI